MNWFKAMLRGISYINPFPVIRNTHYYEGGFERDAEAIAGDWKVVMEDLNAAKRKVKDDLG